MTIRASPFGLAFFYSKPSRRAALSALCDKTLHLIHSCPGAGVCGLIHRRNAVKRPLGAFESCSKGKSRNGTGPSASPYTAG
jgi:hypothetical protein